MNLEEIKAEADSFFEFPTANKDHVTTTSAILFARHCMQKMDNAPWLTLAHIICSDIGILPGEITARLEQLRDLVEANCQRVGSLEAAIIKTLDENGHLADGDCCTLIDLKRVMPGWKLSD